MKFRLKYCLIACLTLLPLLKLQAQGNIEDLLYKEVDNLHPVYKPVIGFGVGSFTFLGDVRNNKLSILNGTLGYKINVATFVDNNHYIRANFYAMGGSLSGNERSATDLMHNLNFKSDILLFGVNLNYDFDNFYKKYRKMHPFISLGIETFTFKSMVDSIGEVEGVPTKYNYWSDGTIRNLPETPANMTNPSLRLMHRDYKYETYLRDYNWGLGQYPQYSFAIPVDVGLDYWLSDRVLFRIGTSYHFSFTDAIDHVSSKNKTGVIGKKGNDNFMFTYFSMHLDLFSSKKTLTVQRLFADVDFDYTLMGDQDFDGAFDGWDKCPDTPVGVKVDSTGCPLDDDQDGVPNYKDQEPNTPYGAYVDDRGVQIPMDKLISMLDVSSAVPRKDVELFLRNNNNKNQPHVHKPIPPKFKEVDTNKDGYISFDEILNEIDKYFDFQTNLTSKDIYELNNFFFSQ